MIKKINNWFKQKLTVILAPGRGSRSIHISLSYPFTAFLVVMVISIFTAGSYISHLYINYLQAVNTNRKLLQEKDHYSRKVEETLDMLYQVKNIETRLRGMLGMKSTRNIIENYYMGGTFFGDDKMNLLDKLDSLYEFNRFNSNVSEVKRVAWEQKQNIKKIESFIDKKRNMLLSTPSNWPIFGYVTSKYGWRTHPLTRKREFHRGLDIYNPMEKKATIRATARGRVVVAGWAGSFGKVVIIDHGNGFSTRYCHCSSIIVKQGDRVKQGQIIAYVGNSGRSTGNHLHYEVWYRGKSVNPLRFVRGR